MLCKTASTMNTAADTAMQEHATLHVPLGDADAAEPGASALTEVAWSPAGTPRALLTVTRGGR